MIYADNQGNITDKTDDIYKVIDEITDYLAGLTQEERIAWFRQTMYAEPLNFIKEIDGTSYIIRTFFKEEATENIYDKLGRILKKENNI
ncbi:MAG: hypothetical protein HFH64_00580 [Lachnospiraceae bacterium]|nr:hypothetical protein [Lachnospiraceae bacterium]